MNTNDRYVHWTKYTDYDYSHSLLGRSIEKMQLGASPGTAVADRKRERSYSG